MDKDKIPKISKYKCEMCHYITDNIKDYNKHLFTAKHTRLTNNKDKVLKYKCELCRYATDNVKDYNKHLSTAKHIWITIDKDKIPNKDKIPKNEQTPQLNAMHICNCGKKYLYTSGLSKHKNICISNTKPIFTPMNSCKENCELQNVIVQIDPTEMPWSIDPSSNEIKMNENMLYMLFKEMMESNNESNKEFKQIILEQQSTILELANKPTINNTNTNSHNKTNITVNMFLNEHCKDAMTINNFIKSINPSMEQIMYMTNHGNREGLIQIMSDAFSSLKITERPIHCTDLKRNLTWVNTDDGWLKEFEQESMKRLCNIINNLCTNKIIEISNLDPEYKIKRSDKHEMFLKMLMESTGGSGAKEQSNTASAINQMKDKLFLGKNEIQNAMLQYINNNSQL